MGNYADTYAATPTTGHLHKLPQSVHQLERGTIRIWHRVEWGNLPALCQSSVQRVRPKRQINHHGIGWSQRSHRDVML